MHPKEQDVTQERERRVGVGLVSGEHRHAMKVHTDVSQPDRFACWIAEMARRSAIHDFRLLHFGVSAAVRRYDLPIIVESETVTMIGVR